MNKLRTSVWIWSHLVNYHHPLWLLQCASSPSKCCFSVWCLPKPLLCHIIIYLAPMSGSHRFVYMNNCHREWNSLTRWIRRCDLVGRSMSLELDFEVSKATPDLVSLLSPTPTLQIPDQDVAVRYCCSTMQATMLFLWWQHIKHKTIKQVAE